MSEDKAYQKGESGKPVALEAREAASDGRRYSPSIDRNKDVIAEVFVEYVSANARVLEIASGTGEHGFHICEAMPVLQWTYSDIDATSRTSQGAWRAGAGHDRLHGPLDLDVTQTDWADTLTGRFDTVFCANMIHIAPFEAARGLIRGAGALLPPGGHLVLYGPFARDAEIAPSNARFSEDLKRRDESWGVRDLERDILPLAEQAGLTLHTVIDMPANNLSVIFQRQPE
ncbi:MAG: DUF938 domain-containing protein [Pseudomonadota bacterium]